MATKKEKQDKLFIRIVTTVLESIPVYQEDKGKLARRLDEAIRFRNKLIIQMSVNVVHSFVARMSSDTISNQIWKTACNLAYATVLEELPASNKLSSVREAFDDDDDDITIEDEEE